MTATVRLSQLTKDYGRQRALDGVDLTINAGEIFGYLGPNGAGKTTTLRLIMGLLRPTSGRAEAFGLDCWRESVGVHRRTGYLPGEPGFYERLTGRETIEYFAGLRQRKTDLHDAAALAERLQLDLDYRVRSLSRGNKQKLAIVQALMSDPDLLVLDEPTSGLDPLVQQEFHGLLREVADRGGTVVLSSHVLDEVQRIADRVGIIRKGRLVAVEGLEQLRAKAVHRVEARLDGPVAIDALQRLPGIRDLVFDAGLLRCGIPQGSLDALVKILGRCRVVDLAVAEADLEEMFLTFYADEQSDAA